MLLEVSAAWLWRCEEPVWCVRDGEEIKCEERTVKDQETKDRHTLQGLPKHEHEGVLASRKGQAKMNMKS